jgi:predicted ferric reductase
MSRAARRGVLAIGVYTALVLLPLALAAVDAPSPRGFWIEFGVGLGFVALAMLGLQFALTARFRSVALYFGQDVMLQFHRQAALVAFALVLAHPVVLLLADPAYIVFFDPRDNLPRALALSGVTVMLILIIATTIWRVQMRIPYEWWRLGHAILAVLILVVGLVHVLRVNHYVAAPWKQAFWALMTGGAMLLLVQMRVIKPLRMLKRPWTVVDVRQEPVGTGIGPSRCWTLTLEPDGHQGVPFCPGQFAWLTIGPSPFAMQQHPFSLASSADSPGRICLTIKELGDHTGRIHEVRPGSRAFLEGPYGAFVLDDGAPGAVFIVGGIGITPILSMLRTMRDRGDRRPVLLIYASGRGIVFEHEILALSGQLNLQVVFVLEEPPEGWAAPEEGRVVGQVSAALLNSCLPPASEGRQHLVCGPDLLMDMVEQHLLSRGVGLPNIRSERFNIA